MTSISKLSPSSIIVLIALALPTTLGCIDVMAVGVAIKTIMVRFNTPIHDAQWLLSAYTLGTAVFLIIFGKLADVYGRRKLLLIGIVIFGLSSLSAALSPSIWPLVISRFIQGLSTAIIMTTSIAIIMHSFSKQDLGPMMAKWASALGVGSAISPLLGGFFLHYLNWQSIFLFNIPFCFLSFFLVLKVLPESKDDNASKKLPYIEAFFLTIMLVSLMTILAEGNVFGWTSIWTVLFGIAFIVSLILFLFTNAHTKNQLFDFSLFTIKSFTPATLSGFLSYGLVYGFLFLFNVYLQQSYGLSTLMAGLAMTPYVLGWTLSAQLLKNYINLYPHKYLMLSGFFVLAGDLVLMSFIHSGTPLIFILTMIFVYSYAIIHCNAPSMTTATMHVPQHKVGVASSVVFTLRWVGGAFGIVLTTLMFKYESFSAACIYLACTAILGMACSAFISKK